MLFNASCGAVDRLVQWRRSSKRITSDSRAFTLGTAVALSGGQEATMKTNSMILALVSSLTLAATAGAAHAQEEGKPKRGTVLVDGQNAKAVVVGPVAIHAYSEFSGAKLFVVNSVSG